MNEQENIDISIFEKNLIQKTATLQECQQNKSLSSCSQCEHFLSCEIRNEYVKAVYESMSKGQQGNFDFN